VTKGYSSDQRVKDFVTFALSKEGRDIIRKAGTVPYADAIGLVMKQVEQYDTAMEKGLYTTAVKNK
jgi:phosphate transport system substrate-binding protein